MEPIRPPDSTRKECLLGSTSPPRRRRRRGTPSMTTAPPALSGARLTWDEDDMDMSSDTTFSGGHGPHEAQAGMQSQEEEEEMLRLALEVSLREEHERAIEASLREEEARQQQEKAKRVEECQQKYGLVQSRLRLMRHPSDPLVDTWLKLVEQYAEGISPDLSLELREELEAWLEKRSRVNPIWNVLGDLLM